MARSREARATAIEAVDGACPRCGAPRRLEQRYCLECGSALPRADAALARMRRLWLRRLGWYPGDVVWLPLLAALLAAAGGVAAVEVQKRSAALHPGTVVAAPPSTGAVQQGGAAPGGTRWPAGAQGWTVVIAALPAGHGARGAASIAAHAAAAGLPQVGVLDSSAFASLAPGYVVVFSGVYGAASDAQTALRSVEARGFANAFARWIAP